MLQWCAWCLPHQPETDRTTNYEKFYQAQMPHSLKLPTDDEFVLTFCNHYTNSKCVAASSTFHLYEMATHQVKSIVSFAGSDGVSTIL